MATRYTALHVGVTSRDSHRRLLGFHARLEILDVYRLASPRLSLCHYCALTTLHDPFSDHHHCGFLRLSSLDSGAQRIPLALMVPAKNYSLRREASICKFATSEKGVQVWGSNLTNFRQCKLEDSKLATSSWRDTRTRQSTFCREVRRSLEYLNNSRCPRTEKKFLVQTQVLGVV